MVAVSDQSKIIPVKFKNLNKLNISVEISIHVKKNKYPLDRFGKSFFSMETREAKKENPIKIVVKLSQK